MGNGNTKKHNPAIVVVGYNRPRSIRRLLDSIAQAKFPDYPEVPLVICIDHSGTGAGKEVCQIAESFEWNHGPKRIIAQKENLGLRNHVLTCGDLTSEYGSIIMLEDDLTVGPEFYRYSQAALEFTEGEKSVGGVSLYNHRTNFICRFPFEPIDDGYDNYYLQIASSWGQAWTASQWNAFKEWYDDLSKNASGLAEIPESAKGKASASILGWPDTSWLKFYIVWLTLSGRYFLYPRSSHTTNNSCSGTNVDLPSHAWQVPLCSRQNSFYFSAVGESLAVYDSHFEVDPDKLVELIPQIADYDFVVDLYGTKNLNASQKEYVLTSRGCKNPIQSFSIGLKPIELNLSCPCDSACGKIVLAKRNSRFSRSLLGYRDHGVLEYFFGSLSIKQILKNLPRYLLARTIRKS